MNNEKRLIDANRLQKEHMELYGKRLLLIDTAPTEKVDNYAHGYQDGIRTVLGEQRGWIPITYRHMNEEELRDVCRFYGVDNPDDLHEDEKLMFDCIMPDDGQRVLISTRWGVFADTSEIITEDGGYYHSLEDRGDWEGVTAWMPAPEKYEPEGGEV